MIIAVLPAPLFV